MTVKIGNQHTACGHIQEKLPGQVVIIALLILALTFSSSQDVYAQTNPRPTLPRDTGPRPVSPRFEVPCGPCHAISIFDPHIPVTDKNNNHTSIQQAINHTKPGGTVIVHRDRNRPWLEPFTVRTPNLTIRAADAEFGGTVVIRQEAMSCVSVEPAGGRRFSAITTTIEGFTFIANDGALEPCINIRKGKLNLINSRIDLGDSNTTGIAIEATGELSFTGKNYDEHGIFSGVMESALPGNPKNGVGISADGSKSVMLSGIRLQGLATGLQSRAEVNALTGVRFFNNSTAIEIEDAAVVSAYAPGLLINGGAFIENADAIVLTAGGFGLDAGTGVDRTSVGAGLKDNKTSKNSFARPFRGRILVTADAVDQVVFERNIRGLSFDNAYPTGGLRIEKVQFLGQSGHALKLNLPLRTRAEILAVDFFENAKAIIFDGSFDGQLTIGNASSIFGTPFHQGIVLDEGRGRLSANFDRAFGVRPLVKLNDYFDGVIELTIGSAVTKSTVFVSEELDLCRNALRNKKDRKNFLADLTDIPVTLNEVAYALLFGRDGKLPETKGDLRRAQDFICGRVLPEDEQ